MTPAAWLGLLDRRLTDRWARMRLFDEYYEGHHRLAFATSKFREAFGSLFAAFADNWAPIVVQASVERLRVQGFRFGESQDADPEAWAIWQDNGLDAEAVLAHTEAVKLGEAYWLVEPPRGDNPPRITAEHPSQMIVAHAAGDRRTRLAALKRWKGDDDHAYCTLYLPDALHKFRSSEKVKPGSGSRMQWGRRADDPGGENPLGVVPVVALRNNPSMLGGGQSDLATAIPLQDAINKLCSDMLVASEYAAYRQRVMTGVETAKYPEGHPQAGQPIPVELGVTRLFTVEAPDAKVFDLQASDLKNYVEAIEMFVQHLAAQTRTPPHYLIGRIVNAAADALKAAEAGLTSKCREKMTTFGEGHEDAMRLALRSMGREVAGDAETIWSDPENRSFGELVDGLVKLQGIGVPNRALQEKAGFSPQEMSRWEGMREQDALLAALTGPPTAPTNGNANGGGVVLPALETFQ